jgi:malate dehydrogenase (oxaloacetate-decarboxylating)(NADP+)
MSKIEITEQEALDYHQFPKAGKICMETTKPVATQRDLSLAYTPGVAVPCLAIEKILMMLINTQQKVIS